jgi:hypothetical protein
MANLKIGVQADVKDLPNLSGHWIGDSLEYTGLTEPEVFAIFIAYQHFRDSLVNLGLTAAHAAGSVSQDYAAAVKAALAPV